MADLAAEGISKTFDDGFRALNDVSFNAASGPTPKSSSREALEIVRTLVELQRLAEVTA